MIKAVPFAPGGSPAIDLLDARLTYGAQLVLSRTPTAGELGVLRTFHDQALIMPATATAKESAVKLHGKSNQELAALTAVASILLNLDAAMTR
jgi:hypothetical protein